MCICLDFFPEQLCSDLSRQMSSFKSLLMKFHASTWAIPPFSRKTFLHDQMLVEISMIRSTIGAGAGKFLGVRRIFSEFPQTFPKNTPKKVT